jgi:hypothetical protein
MPARRIAAPRQMTPGARKATSETLANSARDQQTAGAAVASMMMTRSSVYEAGH